MAAELLSPPADLSVRPIGRICAPYRERADVPGNPFATRGITTIVIEGPYRPALRGVEQESELFVLWWADDARRDVLMRESGTERGRLGVFASRVPDRPNPIMLSCVDVEAVDPGRGTLTVAWCDALDGSPVIDLKVVVRTNGAPR